MPGADLGDRREIARRRDDDAARAHHRLGDEGGDGLGALGLDQRVELGGEAAEKAVSLSPGCAPFQ